MIKNVIGKTKNLYDLLVFLLIAIALLKPVSIYCYLIKYKAKEKHLFPCYVTNNKLEKICINKKFCNIINMKSKDEFK